MQNAETKWNKDIKCHHTLNIFQHCQIRALENISNVLNNEWHGTDTTNACAKMCKDVMFLLFCASSLSSTAIGPFSALERSEICRRRNGRFARDGSFTSPAAFRPRPGAGSPWPWRFRRFVSWFRRFRRFRTRFHDLTLIHIYNIYIYIYYTMCYNVLQSKTVAVCLCWMPREVRGAQGVTILRYGALRHMFHMSKVQRMWTNDLTKYDKRVVKFI